MGLPKSSLFDEAFRHTGSQRYERGSIAITTNLAFEQWTQVFPDAMAASAVIDRHIHHGSVFEFTGTSHRLKSRTSKPPGSA
ncbi:MAG: ATP-binding protein [Vulcanimicrobiaceae bacterium]